MTAVSDQSIVLNPENPTTPSGGADSYDQDSDTGREEYIAGTEPKSFSRSATNQAVSGLLEITFAGNSGTIHTL